MSRFLLDPTPELLATARRVATREWTVGPEESAFTDMDPSLRQLVDAGYAVLYMPPASRLRDDYWTLTWLGEQWLDEHGKN
jgi:hypothetical protein